MNEEQMMEIILNVQEEAKILFEKCGCSSDYCVQLVGSTRIVFGGTNRLIWCIRSGFFPDRSYCTKKFLENWDKI
jgi:hypothetical protein